MLLTTKKLDRDWNKLRSKNVPNSLFYSPPFIFIWYFSSPLKIVFPNVRYYYHYYYTPTGDEETNVEEFILKRINDNYDKSSLLVSQG